MSKKIFGLVTALVASAVLMPNALLKVVRCRQETAWNELCMANALEQYGVYTRHGNHWASSVDKGIHQSFCTCRHEKSEILGHYDL